MVRRSAYSDDGTHDIRIAGAAELTLVAHMPRFGEESAEEMVEWVIDHFGVSTSESATSPTILDVGCGNAHLLLLLAEAVSVHHLCLPYLLPSKHRG